MWWIGASAVAMVVLFLAQGFLLQVAVALTGEPAPRYGRAMWTWMLASLLGAVTSFSCSYSIAWMLPQVLSTALTALLMIGIAALVFKRQFGTSFVQGLAVALIHWVLAMSLWGVTWYFIG